IVRTDAGTLFVAGYGSELDADAPTPFPLADPRSSANPPHLWRSDDGGATWSVVDVGAFADGARGNSDVDLAYGDGTLYLASMRFYWAGQGISVGASEDDGRTWCWADITHQPLVDRPWVAVAPDGAAHLVWNDGVGVHHARSLDRGRTWTQTGLVAERGGSGQLAVSPEGALAARIIPASGSGYTKWEEGATDGVAVSLDGGQTWSYRALPGERRYHTVFEDTQGEPFRWADPLVFDPAGTLYAAWPAGETIVLARSGDLGATWETRVLVEQAGAAPHFPALFANATGELALTWYELGRKVVAHVAHATGADSDQPRVRAASFGIVGVRPGGEYIGALFLPDGSIGVTMTYDAGGSAAQRGFEYRVAR
ncbi:MAG TPA: sialidase family protein, partial [Candidatus Thermoplasmatota archaeon]|nr:sialidase family protein [Candidatus Thermoplasmatota archaeon]